jgi:hypothetical protein
MRYLVVLLIALATSACVTRVPDNAGPRFTVEHEWMYFQRAQREADRHCGTMGKRAQHLGTDGNRLSRFECVDK